MNTESAILFVNGPYQFIVGLACAKHVLPEIKHITIIGYNMKWNSEMPILIRKFCKQFDIKFIKFPLELKKSNSEYTKTYRLASVWNFFISFMIGKFSRSTALFLPKLYDNPERAIISGGSKKHIYIYDDGIGLYLDRILPRKTNKYVSTLRLLRKPKEIFICPSNPSLYISTIDSGFQLLQTDYRPEMKNILSRLSLILNPPPLHFSEKTIYIMLCSSRLSIFKNNLPELYAFLRSLEEFHPNIHFFIKPHPRDLEKDIQKSFRNLTKLNRCTLLPKTEWILPMELINNRYHTNIIISAVSTIVINQYFFPDKKIFITSLLGEKEKDLESKAIDLLNRTSNYYGDNNKLLLTHVNQSIEEIARLLP